MLNKRAESLRLMLQAAVNREDRLMTPPTNARAAALNTIAGKLINAGWVKEIRARNGAPVWRKDEAIGASYALKLTPKGLRAATAMIEAAADGATKSKIAAPATPVVEKVLALAHRAASVAGEPIPALDDSRGEVAAALTRAPRAASKLGRVLDMLAADAGATIGEMTAATGWLEHTTRAALTGLRHRGYELSLTRKERDSASVYRIVLSRDGAAQ